MAEAYGGGIIGRFEQLFDAVPGGMRGPQSYAVRGFLTAALTYGALHATAPINSLMFYESGEAKPWRFSQEGVNAGPENSAPVTPALAALLAGAAAATFI